MNKRSSASRKKNVFAELLDENDAIRKQKSEAWRKHPLTALRSALDEWESRWIAVTHFGGPLDGKPPPELSFYDDWEKAFRKLGELLLASFSDFHFPELRMQAAEKGKPLFEYAIILLEYACDSKTTGQIADGLRTAYDRKGLVDLRFALESAKKSLLQLITAEWPPWTPEISIERLAECMSGMPKMSERMFRRDLKKPDSKWETRGSTKKRSFRHADSAIQVEVLQRIRAARLSGQLD
jgi:hypothetical protein